MAEPQPTDPHPTWIERAHDLHKRQHPVVRRVVVAVIGGILLLVGAALLVLPGPGLLVIAAGIAVLSLEFPWARRVLDRLRDAWRAITERLRSRR
ncbi:MAG TPA: PGPGW domain-containing protein [Actinomycetota bacterium]|nr:PGPGW domain-containing protein [Actinomycetota bacterium]